MMKNIEVTVGLLPDFDIKIEAPVSAADLGGAALPEIKGSADKSAPVISGFTDLTFPDETLSVCGEGLRRASLIVWSEGSLKRITPLRSDDTKLQAVIPADTQKSMLIVWPENENGIGAPVRVNAPTCWFSDTGRLLANTDEQEIRLFGKSLFIEGKKPSVTAICKDKSVKAEIVSANPYRLTIKLNARFYEGEECRFYIHNGTGGKYGFGEPFELTARKITRKPAKELPTLFAEDFGAVADDGKDDSEAFERALEAAAQLGGAVLQLGKGEYNFRKTLYIPDRFPNGLYIRGRGAGDYDFASKLLPDEYEHRGIGGDHTVLRFLSAKSVPENTIRIEGDNISLCDMTVFGADGHAPGYSMAHGYTVHLAGRDITLERVRMIKADLRDFNDDPKARLMCSNHVFVAGGSRNIDILNCEFHTKACAVWINHYEGTDQSVLFNDSTQVRNLRIANCRFYGYTTPYVHPDGRKPIADEGEVSRGITAMNCSDVIVEHNHFEAIDMEHDFVLTRTMYIPISANRMYIAENVMKNVGSTPGTGFDGNTGEQILFHGGMHLGGIYNILKSEGKKLTVRTDNIQVKDENGEYIKPDTVITNAGSRIQDGLKEGKRGMAFICGGKGTGQIREIESYDIRENTVVFRLSEPWIIEPDENSIVVETAPFRENIVYKNHIFKEKPTMAQGFKSGGVLMFFDSYGNIIAENTFSNLAFGVALNTAFKAPLSWNTVRDNTFSGIAEAYKDAMQGGDSTRNSTFFCESVVGNAGETAGWDDYNIWYTAGDVFRNNRCSDGDTAAELATNRWHNLRNREGLQRYFGEEKGNALTVIENNTFNGVADGILIGNPAYWSLIRNNIYIPKRKDGYSGKPLINDQPLTNFKLLYMENDEVVLDENRTARTLKKGESEP